MEILRRGDVGEVERGPEGGVRAAFAFERGDEGRGGFRGVGTGASSAEDGRGGGGGGGEVRAFPAGGSLADGLVVAGGEVARTAAADDDGCGACFGDGDSLPGREDCHDFQVGDEVLLEFLPPPVVRGGYPELKPLPRVGKCDELHVRVLI